MSTRDISFKCLKWDIFRDNPKKKKKKTDEKQVFYKLEQLSGSGKFPLFLRFFFLLINANIQSVAIFPTNYRLSFRFQLIPTLILKIHCRFLMNSDEYNNSNASSSSHIHSCSTYVQNAIRILIDQKLTAIPIRTIDKPKRKKKNEQKHIVWQINESQSFRLRNITS